MNYFDLNIDKVLENWEVYHAIREILANALDETKICDCEPVRVQQTETGTWEIRDFGRGIKIENFTQNENEEKLAHPHLIGQFGVGLKDALATFDRNNIAVKIESKHGIFKLDRQQKHGFESIETLHVKVENPKFPDFEGTSFILEGVIKSELEKAMSLFLDFTDCKPLAITEYGEIYPLFSGSSHIYINGVKVAQEDNFMFSYNITSLTAKIKKSLNRERTNVGRTAYSDRVKDILLKTEDETVLSELADNLNNHDMSALKDELRWVDVGVHAVKVLNTSGNYVFMSQLEMMRLPSASRDILEKSRKKIVILGGKLSERLADERDIYGEEISTVAHFMGAYREAFKYDFVAPSALTKKEREVFAYTDKICRYMNAQEYGQKIQISTTIRPNEFGDDTAGEYHVENDMIIIRRDQLSHEQLYFGVLMHEIIHAKTGLPDVNRDFESELTAWMGHLAQDLFTNNSKKGFLSKILAK